MRKPVVNVMTGEKVVFRDATEALAARIARMRHIVWLGVKAMSEAQDLEGGSLTMYTLTYRGVADWSPRHISGFVRWLRSHGTRAYVWVAELQKRGAVHYHVLSLLPSGMMWTKPNAESGGWSRGFTWVTPNVERPFYIMKYIQKGGSNGSRITFPKGLRLYAVCNWLVRRLQFTDAVSYRQSQLPGWFWKTADDPCVTLRASRVAHGVACKGLVAFSPFVEGGLCDIDVVGANMYTSAWGGDLLPQG
jgi:hypothetical protein